jgi:NADH dehydrogenase FAD-containing subunit
MSHLNFGRAGRVKVNSGSHAARGRPEVFVVGDLMSLDGLPGVAQVAIQSGRHAAATIKRRLAGDAGSRPFRYRDRGSLATISRFRAVGTIGPAPGCRLPRLAALTRRPSHQADRVQEPRSRTRPLDDRLPQPRPRRTRDHGAAGVRPPGARRLHPGRRSR